jgi:hypothetical protein
MDLGRKESNLKRNKRRRRVNFDIGRKLNVQNVDKKRKLSTFFFLKGARKKKGGRERGIKGG